MFNNSSKKPLIVELMKISKQNEAILKFFISGVGNKVFNIGNSPSEVEAYIIDYDFPGAQAYWDTEHSHDNKPRIILSTNDPVVTNSVWVGKPLSSKKLIEAAATIRKLLENGPLTTVPSTVKNKEMEEVASDVIPPRPETSSFSLIGERKNVLPRKKFTTGKIPTAELVSSEHSSSTSEKEDIGNRKIGAQHKTEDSVDDSLTVQQSVPNGNKPKTKEEIAKEAQLQEQRWEELCGNHEDITQQQINELRYVPENYFIGKLTGALRLAKQSQQIVEIKLTPYSVYILPNKHQIFTEIVTDGDSFIQFSRKKVESGEMNIHILSSIETGKLELQMSRQPKHIHSLESFLWTSSLLASQGCLPATMDINKKTVLRYWPSFARIEAFPYSMRIAALWHYSPDTLMEMSKKLAIPQRYVFAFYNGADALGLVEHDPKIVKKKIKAKPKKQGGGLISRLFKRLLKGGGA
jgi:hypothetical protein